MSSKGKRTEKARRGVVGFDDIILFFFFFFFCFCARSLAASLQSPFPLFEEVVVEVIVTGFLFC